MANILILNGAPRKNGATASLIKAFTDGAIASGNEVREAYIQGMDIKNCLGCDACMNTHAGCVQKDEGMAKIYEDIGHVLGAGKEEEARTLGASIK